MFWIINIVGFLLILFVIYWFWLAKLLIAKKIKAVTSDVVDIFVNNGVYDPAIIKIKFSGKIKLRFFRKDPSPCAEYVIFPKLNINAQLPINKPHIVELTIDKPDTYDFTCQMGMYRGKLIVER